MNRVGYAVSVLVLGFGLGTARPPVPPFHNQAALVLEDFEDDPVGQLPKDWRWKREDNEKHKPYRVVEDETGNKYLAAEDKGESIILARDIKWDLRRYRYLSFRWRVHRVPEGGDERYGHSNDSAAGLYVIYKRKLRVIPVSVKFVWSTTLPVGAATQRRGTGRPWNVVVESGSEHLGEWRTYVVDLVEVYRKTFGGNPPSKPVGIAILSDANSTGSQAFADYDDIVALREASPTVEVKEILEAE